MVPCCSILRGSELVGELLSRSNCALRNSIDPVKFRGSKLPDTMPMDCSSIVSKLVLDLNLYRIGEPLLSEVRSSMRSLPKKSPQHASDRTKSTLWKLKGYEKRLTDPRTRIRAIKNFWIQRNNSIRIELRIFIYYESVLFKESRQRSPCQGQLLIVGINAPHTVRLMPVGQSFS